MPGMTNISYRTHAGAIGWILSYYGHMLVPEMIVARDIVLWCLHDAEESRLSRSCVNPRVSKLSATTTPYLLDSCDR